MDLNTALIIFLLIAVVVFILCQSLRIRFFSSLVFALLIAYLVLTTIRPWNSVDGFVEGNFNSLIYLFITFIVPLLVLIYVLIRVFQDREKERSTYTTDCE